MSDSRLPATLSGLPEASPPASGGLARQSRGWQSRTVRRFRRHRLALIGLTVLALLVLMAVFAPLLAGQDPYADNLRLIRKPPQPGHLLGTDGAGRDVWARLVFAARVSLSVGLVAVGLSALIGVTLGSIAGFYGGKVDSGIMRFTDIILCFPTLLVILSVVTIVGPSIFNVKAVIGGFSWPGICRLVRGQFLSLREQDFVLAARAAGAPNRQIIGRHLLPNVVAPVSVAVTLGLASAILTEASLSFLGLGVQVPVPSWGNMLFGATSVSIIEKNWWLWLPPGLLIALAVLGINFVGDGLRDALDPRMRLD
ncbi:MAG: oligopeptide ABC transporter permease [Thermomicrobiales bacterium]